MNLIVSYWQPAPGWYRGIVRDADDLGFLARETQDSYETPQQALRAADAIRTRLEAEHERDCRRLGYSSSAGTHGRGWQRGMGA